MSDQPETVAPEKPAAIPRTVQNDVMQPRPGSLCGQAWDLCAELGQRLGRVPAMSEVVTEGLQLGLNEGNVRVEYSRWKKFHGITARVPDPAKAAALEAKAAAKAAKAEAAAEAKAAKAELAAAAKAAKAEKAEEAAAAKAAKAEAAAVEKAAKAEQLALAKAEAAAAAAEAG